MKPGEKETRGSSSYDMQKFGEKRNGKNFQEKSENQKTV